MEPERFEKISRIFQAAINIDKDRQLEFVRQACGSDESLYREIESLLAYDGEKQAIIDVPAMELAALPLAAEADAIEARRLPARVGRYRILGVLGDGGMGIVYEAEQDHPRRTVALKVIKPALAGPELLRRFEVESQALARLQHPAVAQIYEAGTADAGFGPQPFFAMELVYGASLREYADVHKLNTRQRLELMVRICDGVQHAHQRGIIHRDLKPSNILVDESGQPKVLDFGVARITDSDAQATRQTDLGQIVGTLAYMSPEQVLGDPLELDTRSDVYALGVILYELLTGRLPYTISHNLPEALKTIREEDPARLSSISRGYRGDIETIVAKALEKDKAHRYASAAHMAGDIQRYLKDEPIIARPPSTTYQLQKFARRHKGLVGGLAAIFAVLVAGVIVSTWEATRARRAELTALTESATAKAVNDFLQNDLLAQASAYAQAQPDTRPDPDLKVRTALDRAAARVNGKFGKQPLLEASIRQTIGNTYGDLGLRPDAQRQLERAVDLRRRFLGERHADTLTSTNSLAVVYEDQGKYAQAEPLFTQVLEVRRRVLGAEHPDTLKSMNSLAALYQDQGNYAQAEPLLTQVLEARRRVLGAEHPDTLLTMNNLALLYQDQGKYAQAEPLYIKTLEVARRVLGAEHPDTLISMNNLGAIYYREGKYAQAEPLYTRALELDRHVLGAEHPQTLLSMNNLAVLYVSEEKYVQAEPLLTQVIEARRRVLGAEHPLTLMSINNLAALYRNQGKYPQAKSLLTRTLEVQRRALGAEHPSTLIGARNLALVYQDQGKYTQAEPLFTQVLEGRRRVLGAEHPDTLQSLSDLALIYEYQRKYSQAEPLYNKVLEVQTRVLGRQNRKSADTLASLGRLHLDQQRYADAEPLLNAAFDSFKKTETPEDWTRYNTQSMLGASLAGQKKFVEAEPLLLSGYEGMMRQKTSIPAYNLDRLDEARKRIVQFYSEWGKADKAAEWRQK